mmetsp:Transcript_14536/g.43934  ORF Transcript_14536/g.43934 Transcript_14536/m.43934 type:complete len:336 (-) Transcript_14536:879-1886(-)
MPSRLATTKAPCWPICVPLRPASSLDSPTPPGCCPTGTRERHVRRALCPWRSTSGPPSRATCPPCWRSVTPSGMGATRCQTGSGRGRCMGGAPWGRRTSTWGTCTSTAPACSRTCTWQNGSTTRQRRRSPRRGFPCGPHCWAWRRTACSAARPHTWPGPQPSCGATCLPPCTSQRRTRRARWRGACGCAVPVRRWGRRCRRRGASVGPQPLWPLAVPACRRPSAAGMAGRPWCCLGWWWCCWRCCGGGGRCGRCTGRPPGPCSARCPAPCRQRQRQRQGRGRGRQERRGSRHRPRGSPPPEVPPPVPPAQCEPGEPAAEGAGGRSSAARRCPAQR